MLRWNISTLFLRGISSAKNENSVIIYSPWGQWKVRWSFTVHKTFLELKSKTALQDSHNNYNGDFYSQLLYNIQTTDNIPIKWVQFGNAPISDRIKAFSLAVTAEIKAWGFFLNQFGILGLRRLGSCKLNCWEPFNVSCSYLLQTLRRTL